MYVWLSVNSVQNKLVKNKNWQQYPTVFILNTFSKSTLLKINLNLNLNGNNGVLWPETYLHFINKNKSWLLSVYDNLISLLKMLETFDASFENVGSRIVTF